MAESAQRLMALAPGTRLGPYEVTAQIGEGGMGEVYRATDTNLNRQVAIKVLPEAVASDTERLARFDREAKTLAQLNHPNIAAIYGLERAAGQTALVMELVEGPTLADLLESRAGLQSRQGLPVDEALSIAKQIAEALEAAHEQGIIHRDLKPANIKVRPDGTVKVLDFGLAKALGPDSRQSAVGGGQTAGGSMAPTITTPAMTQMGMILGTAAYMSPEQAKGRAVDKRSDIWAFGAVLYEMLTGIRAFPGEDITDTLAAVVRAEPEWTLLPAVLPSALVTFLKRCLHKDQKQRIPDIATMRLALDGAFETAVQAHAAALPLTRRHVSFAAAAGLALAALTGLAAWTFKPAPLVERPIARFAYEFPAGQTFRTPGRAVFALSPDGRRFVYNTGQGLYVRAMDQLQAQLIPGTEAGLTNPFFSPDGQWVGYFRAGGGQLQKIAITGGAPVAICPAMSPRGASWAPDNTIFFGQDDGIHRVSANGGTSELVIEARPGEVIDGPQLLPGGTWVLFSARLQPMTSWDEATIVVESLATHERHEVWRGGSDARYVSTGHLVYALGAALFAIPFDLTTHAVTGGPIALVEGAYRATGAGSTSSANYAVSDTGALVYVSGPQAANRTLVWVDRAGDEEPIPVPPRRAYTYAQLSPDNTHIALDVRQEERDVWIWDLARQTLQRLTFDPGPNRGPVWMPDGRRVLFSQMDDGFEEIFSQAADGAGMAEAVTKGIKRNIQPTAVLPDGTGVLFTQGGGTRDIGLATLGGPVAAGKWLLASPASETNATVSPDGRWIAYQSDESGREEIYVRPFPAVTTGRWQISTTGGTRPLWSRDGRELFYLAQGSTPGTIAAMAVAVSSGASLSVGPPAKLFEGAYLTPQNGRQVYDVSKDGKRFLMIKAAAADAAAPPPQIIVVQNWVEELRQLVPTK